MIRFLVKRIAISLIVLFVVSVFTALLLNLIPGDAATTILGDQATPATVAAVQHQLGLDQPVLVRYVHWLGLAVHGNLGNSLFSQLPVTGTIVSRLPVTASLALLSLLVTFAFGITLGIFAGLRPGSIVDRCAAAISGVGVAIPHFWFALILLSFFSLSHPWFPATGYTPVTANPAAWALGLVLPVVSMSLGTASVMTRQTRSSMVGVMGKDYVRAALGRGVPYSRVVIKHAFKNALIPIVTTMGLLASTIIGATVFIESVFGLPGLGQLLITSVQTRDIPVVQGIIMFVAVAVVIINLLVDISYSLLNPKARIS